jgi:hypothetical protein
MISDAIDKRDSAVVNSPLATQNLVSKLGLGNYKIGEGLHGY